MMGIFGLFKKLTLALDTKQTEVNDGVPPANQAASAAQGPQKQAATKPGNAPAPRGSSKKA